MPQFYVYARYANEQKAFQLNLITVNDYLKQIFGSGEAKKVRGGAPTMIECKRDFEAKINNIDNITLARNSLIAKTGRKEFEFDEIIKEIDLLDKDRTLKYRFDRSENKTE